MTKAGTPADLDMRAVRWTHSGPRGHYELTEYLLLDGPPRVRRYRVIFHPLWAGGKPPPDPEPRLLAANLLSYESGRQLIFEHENADG